jgi:drug/metabolite transporter (DMT)-like permease
MTDSTLRPALWMIMGAFAFAAMGTLTHGLGARCDWLLIALVRALFMLATTALMAHWRGVRLRIWDPPTLWMRSLAGSFSLVCNFFAMTRMPLSEVLTLSNAYPLWIIVLGSLVVRRWPTMAEAVAVACGLAGVVVIERPDLAGGANSLAGAVAVVGSISTAVAMLGLHRLRAVEAPAIVAHFAGVASLVAGAWMLLSPRMYFPGGLDVTTAFMLLGVGITGTVGQFLLTKAYAHGLPARISVIGLVQVVFALGFDLVFWGRSVTPSTIVGLVLVLAPTAWTMSRTSPPPVAEPDGIPIAAEAEAD